MLSKMKQDTNESQTAKLIELGCEMPKNERRVLDVVNESTPSIQNIVKRQDYSISELIEMLPKEVTNVGLTDSLSIYTDHNEMWTVEYSSVLGELFSTYRTELVDALYDMVV